MNGTRIRSLANCVSRIEVGRSVNGDDDPALEGEIGVLRTSAVLGGTFNPYANKRVVTNDLDLVRVPVSAGTVIFNRSNSIALVGASALVTENHPNLYLPDKLWALTPDDDVDPGWLHAFLSSNRVRGQLRASASGTSAAMKNISMRALMSIDVPLPPLPEQRKIAEILRTWDDAIETTISNHRLAASRYASAIDTLLTGKRSPAAPLSTATRPITRRNTDLTLGRDSVMGVTNSAGIVPMRAQTIAADLSRYQVLPPRAFAYNPMRINVGSIAMSRLERDVLVSPDYVLFECVERVLMPEYLDHVLETRRWRHNVNAGASGSVRTRTYYDDLAAIPIHMPAIADQAEIVALLDSMTAELALLDRKIELLRTQKRGLMQKLLTGDIRVTVEGAQP